MAKLIIYRGDTLDREIELGERNARIGRGDQNEIVLPDPAKSVSRFHAELRYEQGRYTVVDLNSQNGTWVAGRRVPQVVLEPGVPVVLGTYRIVLKKEEAPASPEETDATLIVAPIGPAAASPVTSTSSTMVGGVPVPVPAPAAAAKSEVPKPAPAPKPDVPKPEAPKPAPAAAVKAEAPKPAPAPAAKPELPKPAAVPKPDVPKPPPAPAVAAPAPAPPAPALASKPAAPRTGGSKGLLVGGLVAAVLILAAAAVFFTPLRTKIPGLSGAAPDQASAQPGAGSAGGETVPPSETASPSRTVPPSEAPAPPPASEAAAPLATPVVPAAAPASVPPRVAKPPVPAGVTATRTPDPTAAPGARAAAGGPTRPAATPAGGRRGRESAAPAAKPLNLAQTLEEARAAMIKGDYLAAIAGFEAVLKVDPKYQNAADLLGVAKGGARNAAQLAIDSGNKAEMGGDYAAAAKQYDRALQLDPESSAAPDAIRRMKARMLGEGEDAFKRARQYDALGRGKDAIPLYEKALQLLPADNANVAVAKERLAALKGGLPDA